METTITTPTVDLAAYDAFVAEVIQFTYITLAAFNAGVETIAATIDDPIAREALEEIATEVRERAFDSGSRQMITIENRVIDRLLDLRNVLAGTPG